jgi:hypothetical protein
VDALLSFAHLFLGRILSVCDYLYSCVGEASKEASKQAQNRLKMKQEAKTRQICPFGNDSGQAGAPTSLSACLAWPESLPHLRSFWVALGSTTGNRGVQRTGQKMNGLLDS